MLSCIRQHIQSLAKTGIIMSDEYVMRCAIWYHLYNFKNVKNAHGGMLLLIKLQALASNFTKTNTPPCAFFMFSKWNKWYQIVQRITYCESDLFKKDWLECNQTFLVNSKEKWNYENHVFVVQQSCQCSSLEKFRKSFLWLISRNW